MNANDPETSKNFLIVTGAFNNEGGKASYFGTKLYEAFKSHFDNNKKYSIESINGGIVSDLDNCALNIEKYKIIFWMPHIEGAGSLPTYGSNNTTIDKFSQIIKAENKTAIFIQVKRNDYNKFTVFEIVEGMFKIHANLCLTISKDDSGYSFKVLDPLGNLWYCGTDIASAANRIAQFTNYLSTLNRIPSVRDGTFFPENTIIKESFIDIVRFYGWRFSILINTAINKERFFGNASTRCMQGFPSVRDKNTVLISRRDIDKEFIEDSHFVPVRMENDVLYYALWHKPSVDAPIQIKLYQYYHKVNYIIHGHTYVMGAPMTKRYVPCGYIEEADEITSIFKDHLSCNFSINLPGHGCLILAENIEYFAGLGMLARDFPEDMSNAVIGGK
jgi:hypothetical protein